jgi:hypothetical protein
LAKAQLAKAERHASAQAAFSAMVERAAQALYLDCANFHHRAHPSQ